MDKRPEGESYPAGIFSDEDEESSSQKYDEHRRAGEEDLHTTPDRETNLDLWRKIRRMEKQLQQQKQELADKEVELQEFSNDHGGPSGPPGGDPDRDPSDGDNDEEDDQDDRHSNQGRGRRNH